MGIHQEWARLLEFEREGNFPSTPGGLVPNGPGAVWDQMKRTKQGQDNYD